MGLALGGWLNLRTNWEWQHDADCSWIVFIQRADVRPGLRSLLAPISALGLLAVDLDTIPKDSTTSIAAITRSDYWYNSENHISRYLAEYIGNFLTGNRSTCMGCGMELANVDAGG